MKDIDTPAFKLHIRLLIAMQKEIEFDNLDDKTIIAAVVMAAEAIVNEYCDNETNKEMN